MKRMLQFDIEWRLYVVAIVAILSLVGVSEAKAEVNCSNIACTGPMSELVKRVVVTEQDGGTVQLELAPEASVLNCTLLNNAWSVLRADHLLFDEIYSAIMMASATNKQFRIRIAENTEDCKVLYIQFWN